MIEFEAPKPIAQQSYALKTVAENMMRPVSRYFDENEHEIPWDYINFMHMAMRSTGAGSLAPRESKKNGGEPKEKRPADRLPVAGIHARDALLGRCRHVPVHARRRSGRSGGRSNRHSGAEARNSWRVSRRKNQPLALWQ